MGGVLEDVDAALARSVALQRQSLRLRLTSTLLALRSEELLLASQLERHLRRAVPVVPPRTQA